MYMHISRWYSLIQVCPCTFTKLIASTGPSQTLGTPETDRQSDKVYKTKLHGSVIVSVCTGLDSVWSMWSKGARGKFSTKGRGGGFAAKDAVLAVAVPHAATSDS